MLLQHGWVWIPGQMNAVEIQQAYQTMYKNTELDAPTYVAVLPHTQHGTACYSLSNPMENMALYNWVGGGDAAHILPPNADQTTPIEIQRIWHRHLPMGNTIEILKDTHRPGVASVVIQSINTARRRTKLPIQWNTQPGVFCLSPVPITVVRKYIQSVPHTTDHTGGTLFCLGSLCLIHNVPCEWVSISPRVWMNVPMNPTLVTGTPDVTDQDSLVDDWRHTQQLFIAAVFARLVRPADVHLFHTMGLVHRDICQEAATTDLQLDWETVEHKFLMTTNHSTTDIVLGAQDNQKVEHYGIRSHNPQFKCAPVDRATVNVECKGGIKMGLPVCPRAWLLHGVMSTLATHDSIKGFSHIDDLSLPYGHPLLLDEPHSHRIRIKIPSAFSTMGCTHISIRRSPNEERHVLMVCGKCGVHFTDGPSAIEALRQHVLPELSVQRYLQWDHTRAPAIDRDSIRLSFSDGAEIGTLQTCLCLCLIVLYPMATLDEVVSIGVVIGLHVLRDNRTLPLAAVHTCLLWQDECRKQFWLPYRPAPWPIPLAHSLIGSMDNPFVTPIGMKNQSRIHEQKHRPRLCRASLKTDPTENVVVNPEYEQAQQYILAISKQPRNVHAHKTSQSQTKPKLVTRNQQFKQYRAALNRATLFENRIIKHVQFHNTKRNNDGYIELHEHLDRRIGSH
jgi:hypothetical protein